MASGAVPTWRYLFNDVGDLIAVRDPRGCGQNFYYDHAGRLIAEDYVECGEVMEHGDLPAFPLPVSAIAEGEIGTGAPQYVDARYYFDEDPEFIPGFFPSPRLVGRASGSVDRTQASAVAYDARGQAETSIRIMAVLPEARTLHATITDLSDDGVDTVPTPVYAFDYGTAYFTSTKYDYMGRPVEMMYPDSLDGTSVSNVLVRGRLSYNRLGLPTATHVDVFYGSTAGMPAYSTPIVRDITYDENRLPTRLDYGDSMVTHDLHTEMYYDNRLRPVQSVTARDLPMGATALNAVTTVHDFHYVWDAVSNLTEVRDEREVDEWPAGYRPWRQTIEHDALYRVNEIDINYRDDSDDFTPLQDDVATDWRTQQVNPNDDSSSHGEQDPMRRRPAGMVSPNASTRVRNLVYDYDWLANMTDWTDDKGVSSTLTRMDRGVLMRMNPPGR